jgi:nitroimidazol reductase NimA-like FMN-containing flavoprotein (pyridoxamine 5'-phosphate oxidase superfamily)
MNRASYHTLNPLPVSPPFTVKCMGTFQTTARTTVRRLPKRGVYDKDVIYSILDEGFICHIGFTVDGQPYVIPTGYARIGETLYIHGSAASRMLKTVTADSVDMCLTVTLLDGLVLARSAFHHSMNYRSVVVLGKARPVTDDQEKRSALHAFTNHIVPLRWEETREPTPQELKATSVLALPIEEASAKVRTGPPVDDEEDYALPVWAGVIPVEMKTGAPIPDARMLPDIPEIDLNRFTRFDKVPD